MGVTIYDIAERAKVSIATVSRVFNNNPRVSARTRTRVLRVAQELGYEPHPSAQSLARRKPSLVSAVIPMVTNFFFMEVLKGLQDRLGQSEFDLLVHSARTMDEVGTQLHRALHRGRSAGVLLFSTPLLDEHVARIRRFGQSAVLVDCSHPEFDSVFMNNEEGGYLATRHLVEEGCSRIALVMGHPESVPAFDRYRGYRRALEGAGIEFSDRLVIKSDDRVSHGYTEAFGRDAMAGLLEVRPRPDAVFATSDVQAFGVLCALRDAHLRVPDDVAVIGFDDILVSKYIGLSTLQQPMYEVGRLAAERLLSRLQDPDRVPAHTVFLPRLVRRISSDLHSRRSSETESMTIVNLLGSSDA